MREAESVLITCISVSCMSGRSWKRSYILRERNSDYIDNKHDLPIQLNSLIDH